jgi:hypothetical protein
MLILRLRLILTELINISLFDDFDLATDFTVFGLMLFKLRSLTVKTCCSITLSDWNSIKGIRVRC